MENKAKRYNSEKTKWGLVHYKSLEPMIDVLQFGAKKYDPWNWTKPMCKREILESMQRHLSSLFDGEEFDSESGLPHMGHIQANAMFYNYHSKKESNKIIVRSEDLDSMWVTTEEEFKHALENLKTLELYNKVFYIPGGTLKLPKTKNIIENLTIEHITNDFYEGFLKHFGPVKGLLSLPELFYFKDFTDTTHL